MTEAQCRDLAHKLGCRILPGSTGLLFWVYGPADVYSPDGWVGRADPVPNHAATSWDVVYSLLKLYEADLCQTANKLIFEGVCEWDERVPEMFVRIQSWDETARAIEGKKVRVTVEVIE